MDHACYDFREGRMTRKEAIDLVLKLDGKCSQTYIKKFCDFIEISEDDFWKTVEKFRGDMWEKDENGNWRNKVSEILSNIKKSEV